MVQVIAHRGASHAVRENTLDAFKQAAALGAHAVELDVRRTADGVLVVHHDPVSGPDRRPIVACRRDELEPHIPTLADALDACAGLWVNVEIKNDPVEPDFDPTDRIADVVLHALMLRGEHQRWLISSFRWETIERCRALEPTVATAWLTVQVPSGTARRLHLAGHRALHPHWRAVDPALVAQCHALGVEVNVWTCDDPEAMRQLIAWGVDGICTNVPDVALEVLRVGS